MAWPALAGTAAPNWQRVWTVQAIICPACGSAELAQLQSVLGARITLAPDRFENPLYESCLSGVDYGDLLPRPRDDAALLLRPGQLPATLPASVVAGSVGCAESNGPSNTIGKFVFAGAIGYYLFEGGALLELR